MDYGQTEMTCADVFDTFKLKKEMSCDDNSITALRYKQVLLH